MSTGPLVVLTAILKGKPRFVGAQCMQRRIKKKKVYNDMGSVEPETDGRVWASLMATYRCKPPLSTGW